jgi:hypothetical protein
MATRSKTTKRHAKPLPRSELAGIADVLVSDRGSERARLLVALDRILALLPAGSFKSALRRHALGKAGAKADADFAILLLAATQVDSIPGKLRTELVNKAKRALLEAGTFTPDAAEPKARRVHLDASSPTAERIGWLLEVARSTNSPAPGLSVGWRSYRLAWLIPRLFPDLVTIDGSQADLAAAIDGKPLPAEVDDVAIVMKALAAVGASSSRVNALFSGMRKQRQRERRKRSG